MLALARMPRTAATLTLLVLLGLLAGHARAQPVNITLSRLRFPAGSPEAMAAAPVNRRSLRLDLSATEEHYQLRISDRGCGIAPAVKEQLFSPFFTTKVTGMGMGLNICRSIIEFHHGRLWAEDHPEGGAIFIIALPKHIP